MKKIKNLKVNKKNLNLIKKGMKMLYKVVSSTFGPYGKNVILERNYGIPIITKDGYRICREVNFKNKLMNIGSDIIKCSSKKINEEVGDGTTTSIILTYNIIKSYIKYINKKNNFLKIKNQIKEIAEIIIKKINKISLKIKKNSYIKKVAFTSSNNDKTISSIIYKTIKNIGNNNVNIEESNFNKDKVIIEKGLIFEEGFIDKYFKNEYLNKDILMIKPILLIYLGKIKKTKKILNIMEYIYKNNKSLLILTDGISKEVSNNIIINNIRNSINIIVVKIPYKGIRKIEFLNDICIYSNSKIFTKKKFFSFNDLKKMGVIKKALISYNKTIINSLKKNKNFIKKRAKNIFKEIKSLDNDYDIVNIKERVSRLLGGVATINVGGKTETEMIERKYRFEDSLNSTKASIEEGIVPGGGLCFLKIFNWLKRNIKKKNIGYKILSYSLKKPFEKIYKKNLLKFSYKNIKKKILKNESIDYGYDPINNIFCRFYEKGIVDSAKLVKCALKTSISVANIFISSKFLLLTSNDIKSKIF
ncbi:chaperonin GroEL [Candidatus Vidania fulgoroideorum]